MFIAGLERGFWKSFGSQVSMEPDKTASSPYGSDKQPGIDV